MRLLNIFLIILLSSLSGVAYAKCQTVAKLVAIEGQVSIKPNSKVLKTSPGALPRSLCAGDEIHTLEGRALIHDGRFSVAVDSFSLAVFTGMGKAALNKGQALFDIRKRTAQRGVEVKTRLSVIGVKGTRFLVVDKDEGVSVVLDQGVIDITSTQGPIGLYRETTASTPAETDFETYARQHAEGVASEKSAFEQYKSEVQREFVAYVESLTLEAGKELVTQGCIAVERRISSESAQAIKSLRAWQDKN
jgi:hypothetical protein